MTSSGVGHLSQEENIYLSLKCSILKQQGTIGWNQDIEFKLGNKEGWYLFFMENDFRISVNLMLTFKLDNMEPEY